MHRTAAGPPADRGQPGTPGEASAGGVGEVLGGIGEMIGTIFGT